MLSITTPRTVVPTVSSRSEVMITGTRCWPVVWLPGMPRMRSCGVGTGIDQRAVAGRIDAVVDADDEAGTRVLDAPECRLSRKRRGQVGRHPTSLGVLSFNSLTMTDWPGLGIVSPSASTVPGSADWIVSETTAVGTGP